MKSLKAVVIGLAVIGSVVAISLVSFADEGHMKEKIKTLNEAAAALKQSSPDLSAGLSKYAEEEAMEGQQKEHIKLLRDSAAALESSNPALADTLTKMADRHQKRMEMGEKKEEKQEIKAMEKTETKEKKW